jgi:c-di-GMP-binding flagellar brake protein YcgR
MRFRREARKHDLRPHHVRFLLDLVKRLGLQDPMRIFRDQNYLTHTIRRAIRELNNTADLTDAEREERKHLLFQVKRLISDSLSRRRTIGSSRRLRVGREVRISPDGKTWHETMVTSNIENALGVRAPEDRRGRMLRFDKGTPLTVSLVTEQSNKLYTFESRVMGISRSRGVTSLLLAHTNEIKQTQKRKYPRRESDRPAFFWPVAVITTGTGKNQRRQAVISNQRRGFGRIEDISAGGCAIRTSNPLNQGSLIKIEFETTNKERLSAFGKIRHTERTPSRYGIMHIMFTRVSRKNLNRIEEYVYGLMEDDEQFVSNG